MRWKTALFTLTAVTLVAIMSGGQAHAENAKCGLSNGKAAAGDPIIIGGIVSVTGPDNFSSSGLAAAAYFKCLNANGGINGRPVKYLMEDDAWNPEQSSQLAAKLIRDQGAVALVGNMSFVDCGANQGIYEKEDIMVIAGVGVPRDCFFQKNYAPDQCRTAGQQYQGDHGSRQDLSGQDQAHRLHRAQHSQCGRMVVHGCGELDQDARAATARSSRSIRARSMRRRSFSRRWPSSPTPSGSARPRAWRCRSSPRPRSKDLRTRCTGQGRHRSTISISRAPSASTGTAR